MAGDHHGKSREWGPYEPGTMPCERSHLRFFYAFQVWRWRSSRNIIRTPSDRNTLPKGPHCSTIHTGNSGSLSALAKRFSTIRTPGNVSMLLRAPCRATIPTRSSESLSALTSCRDPSGSTSANACGTSARPKKRKSNRALPSCVGNADIANRSALTRSMAMSDTTDRCGRVYQIGEMSWCGQLDWLWVA
jgi:hypothetical protein